MLASGTMAEASASMSAVIRAGVITAVGIITAVIIIDHTRLITDTELTVATTIRAAIIALGGTATEGIDRTAATEWATIIAIGDGSNANKSSTTTSEALNFPAHILI